MELTNLLSAIIYKCGCVVLLSGNMANPIRATPTLRGTEAVNFMKEVLHEQKHPSGNRIALLKQAEKIKFNC